MRSYLILSAAIVLVFPHVCLGKEGSSVQEEFARGLESHWDGLRGDCETMLIDIYGGVRNLPQFKLAVALLSADEAIHERAVRQLRAKETVNKYEMEAVSLMLLTSQHSEPLLHLFRIHQRLETGSAFWNNIRTAMNRSEEAASFGALALRFLNSRSDLVAQAPDELEVQVAKMAKAAPEGSAFALECEEFLRMRESFSRR